MGLLIENKKTWGTKFIIYLFTDLYNKKINFKLANLNYIINSITLCKIFLLTNYRVELSQIMKNKKSYQKEICIRRISQQIIIVFIQDHYV